MKPGDGVDGRAGRIPVGDHFKALARNKYWWLTLGLNFALWTYNGMAAYIAKYVLGNSNLIAVIGLATVIPMVIGLPFAGPLVARFGKRNASMAGLVLVAVGSLLVFVDPSNLWVFFVSIIVRMVGIIPMNAALNAMSGDVVEYGEWRSGVRSDGIVFSSSSFSMKVAMGVSSAAIAWILGASGYDARSPCGPMPPSPPWSTPSCGCRSPWSWLWPRCSSSTTSTSASTGWAGSSPPVACSAKAIGISVESGHASSGCAPGLVGVGL